MNGFELGRIIVDAFVAFYEDKTTYGAGMDGTLTVINTKNFRERLVAPITAMALMMDRELKRVGKYNLLLNFEDELRSQAASYEYYDPSLLDFGNFTEHLGMCISELTNTDAFYKIEDLGNGYTKTEEDIRKILRDADGSGDDVIYTASTATMTRPPKTKVAYTRDAEGEPQQVETFTSSGLSIFFAPTDLTAMDYAQAVDEMCAAVDDEGIRTMLRAWEVVSLRYMLAVKSGRTVFALREDGEENVYYKSVKYSWQDFRDLDYDEINRYKRQVGISGIIVKMMPSDWDSYISPAIELLNRYSDVDTDTWLALLIAQQSSQAIDASKASAIGVDKTGDGVMDAYRVTVPSPLNLVSDVSLSLSLKLVPDEELAELKEFTDMSDYISIGRVHGDPVQESVVSDITHDNSLTDGVKKPVCQGKLRL